MAKASEVRRVLCPHCGVEEGFPCVTRAWRKPMTYVHAARVRKYERLHRPEAVPGEAEG